MGLVNLIIKLGLDRSAVSRGIKQGTMEWEQGQVKMSQASARFTSNLTRAWAVAIPAAMAAGIRSGFRSILRIKDEADDAGLSPVELLKAQMMAAQSGKSMEGWQKSIGMSARQAVGGMAGGDAGIGKGVQAASDVRSGAAQVGVKVRATLAAMFGDMMSALPEAAPLKMLMRSGQRGREGSLNSLFNVPTNPDSRTSWNDSEQSDQYLKDIRDTLQKIERARAANSPGQFP